MLTRITLIVFSLSLLSCSSIKSQQSSKIEIDSITPKYMEHNQFVSINEYLTGKENKKNRLIIRSDESVRDGLYLVLSLNKSVRALPADTNIICEIYLPGKINPEVFEFPLPRVNKFPSNKDILLGFTGSNWSYGKDATPTAWKITLMDSQNTIIAEKSSQVWSL